MCVLTMEHPKNIAFSSTLTLVILPLLSLLLLGACEGCARSAVSGETKARLHQDARVLDAKAAPSVPLRVVRSLIDNRLLAHWSVNGGLFVPGDHGLAKYLDNARFTGDWRLGPKQLAAGGVVAVGRRTRLVLPLSAKQALAAVVTIKLQVPTTTTLRLRLGSKALPAVRLEKGWHRQVFTFAPGLLKSGDNRLQIDWGNSKQGRVMAWLHVGARMPKAASELPRVVEGRLYLPHGTGISWLVYPPTAAQLALRFHQEHW